MDRTICIEVLEGIGIDETAGFGVIITGLQVIEARLHVVIIPTVADGVDVEDIGDGGVRLYYTKPQNACQYKETPPTEGRRGTLLFLFCNYGSITSFNSVLCRSNIAGKTVKDAPDAYKVTVEK